MDRCYPHSYLPRLEVDNLPAEYIAYVYAVAGKSYEEGEEVFTKNNFHQLLGSTEKVTRSLLDSEDFRKLAVKLV